MVIRISPSPNWKYGDDDKRTVPPAFRNLSSPLYHVHRDAEINDGMPPTANPAFFSVDVALNRAAFYRNDDASSRGGDSRASSLENSPHNFVHAWVGGDVQWNATAALAPLF